MRALIAAAVFATVLASAVSLTAPVPTTPTKPVWPPVFDAPFGLYIPTSPGYKNLTSHFWYDWSYEQNTMIAYPDLCLPALSTTKGCNLVFNNNGTYAAFAIDKKKPIEPGNQKCCLFLPGVGSVPPDFLKPYNYSKEEYAHNLFNQSIMTYYWVGVAGFTYNTDVKTGEDIALVDGGTITWQFGALSARPNPNRTMFDTSMCSQSCHSMADSFDGGMKTVETAHPDMIRGSGPHRRV